MAELDRRDGPRRWVADVRIVPKPGVNDPEGVAILGGLRQLGFDGVSGVRAGRFFEVTVDAPDADAARSAVVAMCDRLLANPVIESYEAEVRGGQDGATRHPADEGGPR